MFDRLWNILTKSVNKSDEDFVDRMNYKYTSTLLFTFSLLTVWYEGFGEAIQCWTPTYFAGSWIDYTNNLCLVQNTYFLPMSTTIEKGREMHSTYNITYYQWLPMMFIGLSVLYYVPRALWYHVFSHHFVDINAIVDLLTSFDNAVNPETRDPPLRQVAYHIEKYLKNSVDIDHNFFCEWRRSLGYKFRCFIFYFGRRYGLSVWLVYISTKLTYVTISMFEAYWIDIFLQGKETSPDAMGIFEYYYSLLNGTKISNVLSGLRKNTKIRQSPIFPLITYCDFTVRSLGQNHNFTVQCVLPINLFNEKIFLFLWLWIFVLFLITFVNSALWFYRIAFARNRSSYVMKHLILMNKIEPTESKYGLKIRKKIVRHFIHEFLRPDGIFLLRLISINTNCLITSEIISSLFEIYVDSESTQAEISKWREKYAAQNEKIENSDNRVSRTYSKSSHRSMSIFSNEDIPFKKGVSFERDDDDNDENSPAPKKSRSKLKDFFSKCFTNKHKNCGDMSDIPIIEIHSKEKEALKLDLSRKVSAGDYAAILTQSDPEENRYARVDVHVNLNDLREAISSEHNESDNE